MKEQPIREPKFQFGTLLITKPIEHLKKTKRTKNEFITVSRQPMKIRSILADGSFDSCIHKIYRGENIYFFEGVPCGIGEDDLMEYSPSKNEIVLKVNTVVTK